MNFLRTAVPVLCVLALAGCQKYEPAPLDLRAYHAALETRDLSSLDVSGYVRQLNASTTQPIVFDPADGLSLPEAEVVALLLNPDLRVARLKAQVPRVGAAEAGRWEDPELAFDLERITNSVKNPWVIGGMLNLTIPLSGRLGVEKEALAEATVEELRALAEERRVIVELRGQWAMWSASMERTAQTRAIIQDLQTIETRAERLRAVGELGPLDARLFRLERIKHSAKLIGYETESRAAEARLKSSLGLLPSANVALVPSFSQPATPIPQQHDVAALVQAHPKMLVLRAEYELAESSLKLEVKKQFPDLKLGGGFGTDEGDDRILFGASVPIPVLNANRRAIAEARARRDAAREAAYGEFERLLGEVDAAKAESQGARHRLEYVEKELAPLADQQVADARRIAQAGEIRAMVMLEALSAAQDAKLDVIEARLQAAIAQSRLEGLLTPSESTLSNRKGAQ